MSDFLVILLVFLFSIASIGFLAVVARLMEK